MNVRFDEVTMTYGEKDVLEKISFDIPEGKLVSILGPSGCGKSTTLMLISGLTFPTEGDIYFGNEKVTKADAVKRKVGMVFQNYALYPHLTVLENIMFPLRMEKRPKKERIKRAKELADLVQIGDHIDKKPKQLSGGQQQRVAIARALAKEPSILLMDEPLSNLDARLRIEMREEIRRIQQETGVTTIFVTHDQEEALSISDEVMVLNGGSIHQKVWKLWSLSLTCLMKALLVQLEKTASSQAHSDVANQLYTSDHQLGLLTFNLLQMKTDWTGAQQRYQPLTTRI